GGRLARPALQVAFDRGGVPIAEARASSEAHRAPGARAEAEVIVPAPVAEVVESEVFFAGVVADLVVEEALRLERLVDGAEGLGDETLVQQGELAPPRESSEVGVRLDGECVGAQVGDARRGEASHLGRRLLWRLPGDPEDQIRADAGNPGAPRGGDGLERALGIVQAPEKFQSFGVQRLHPQADAVHADVDEAARVLLVEARGVALDGDLERSCFERWCLWRRSGGLGRAPRGAGRGIPWWAPPRQGGDDPPELFRRPQGRRPATEEDRSEEHTSELQSRENL